ncbi:MAG TPA: GGDEF domain-containing protein [Nocardioides sp.]|nr:GGDEF domain-containing protein [Nocardioides sp.]
MKLLSLMEPRDHHAARRAVLSLVGVASVVTVVFSPFLPAENQLGTDAAVTGAAILGVVVLLSFAARSFAAANVSAWALCPLLAVVALVVLDVLTDDGGVDAQIFFVFPALYGASQLRPVGSAIMTGAAVVGECVVVAVELPVRDAIAQGGYVCVALVAVSVMLTVSSERQARLVKRLEQMAAVDSLTGLVTRRVFDEAAASALTGANSEDGTCLILLDVDHFKSINDEHGHPAGDEVLVQLAHLLVADIRRHDVVCRLGGDEIAVLMPGCSRDDAHRRAEQILADVRAHPFEVPGSDDPLHVSVSLGLAHAPSEADDVRSLYATADTALYRAKQGGRGRVATAEV